jgi:pimeloyl-ACP methyl ester carboxylesterase
MSFDTVQRVKVDGIELAFREAGGGEPLLLVHGWPLSSLTWRKVVPALADGARCIAPDLLGAGESLGPLSGGCGLEAQGRRLAGFLDALGIDRATVIGHDSGGSVARSFAAAHPERVARLVLADTEVPGHRPLFVRALQLANRVAGATALLRRVMASQRLARSPLGFGLCFADLGRFDFGEFFEALVEPNVRSEEAFRGMLRFLRDFDFGEVDALQSRYGSLVVPKCVIWGERDAIFPLEQGRRLFGMLPEPKRFETVADAGLRVPEERPEEWVRIVRSFLAEAPPPPA